MGQTEQLPEHTAKLTATKYRKRVATKEVNDDYNKHFDKLFRGHQAKASSRKALPTILGEQESRPKQGSRPNETSSKNTMLMTETRMASPSQPCNFESPNDLQTWSTL